MPAGVVDALALRSLDHVHISVVRLIIPISLAISDRRLVGWLAQLLVKFNSGIEQGAWSTTKGYGRGEPAAA